MAFGGYSQNSFLNFEEPEELLSSVDGGILSQQGAVPTGSRGDVGGLTQDDTRLDLSVPAQSQSTNLIFANKTIGNNANRPTTVSKSGPSNGETTITDRIANLKFEDDDDAPAQVTSTLNDFACSYCGISETKCLVMCLQTKKWFCNGRGGLQASHIIQHLVRSRRREVQLHKSNPLGAIPLECFVCGSTNLFELGFVPATDETALVILCRVPCSQNAAHDQRASWDPSKWQPLVYERALLKWLVEVPTPEQEATARRITQSQINRLEELWKERPNANVDELETSAPEAQLQQVPLRYDDGRHYQSIWFPLVQHEAKYDQSMKSDLQKSGIDVRWDVGLNKKHLVYFTLPIAHDEFKVMQGDELRLVGPPSSVSGADDDRWSCLGTVIKVPDNHSSETCLQLKHSPQVPRDQTKGFTVQFVWKATSFDRMNWALRNLAMDEHCISGYLFQKLLGHEVDDVRIKSALPKRFSAPGLPELNHSQVYAVRNALQSPMCTIQGPPGTGKTVTSATIVYHLVKMGHGPVLVCAPSNIAVDQLAEKMAATQLRVVRLYARSREMVDSPVANISLHNQLRRMPDLNPELKRLQQLKDETGELLDKDETRFKALKEKTEIELLKNAEVVCCTCVCAGDRRLRAPGMPKMRAVLMDESSQACEPEALIPVVLGCRHLILVGDHCQLGPVVTCKEAARAGLAQSLFSRLVLLGNRPLRLQVQYRMHPALSRFPSDTFYDGSLQNGVTVADRTKEMLEFPWPEPSKPTFFYSVNGVEEISSSGTSFLNRTEAAALEKLIARLVQRGSVKPEDIGVITPYEGQRAFLVTYFKQQGKLPQKIYEEIEVASVDAFQGREKDYILLSCVRSSEKHGIGFLADPRRLNVALTRARFGLVIFGNPRVLTKNVLWCNLLNSYKDQHLLVEGSNLDALQESNIQLPKPKPLVNLSNPGASFMQSTTYDAREYFSPAPNKVQAPASAAASNVPAAGAVNFQPYGPLQPSMLSQSAMPFNFNPYANPQFYAQQPSFGPIAGYRDPMAALAAANLQPFGSGGFMPIPSIGLFMTPDAMAAAQQPAQWGGYSRMRAMGAARGGSGSGAAGGRPGAGRAGTSVGHAATPGSGNNARQQLSQVGQHAPLSQMQGGVADASPALLSQDAAGIASLSGLHSAGAETASQTLSFTPADVIFPGHDFTSQQSQSVDTNLLSQR